MNKIVLSITISLFLLFAIGLYSVLKKVNDSPYQCTVVVVDIDGNQTIRSDIFTNEQIEAIQDHGGGMLGAHIDDLTENASGDLTTLIRKQEEAFSGAVVCKKYVSF